MNFNKPRLTDEELDKLQSMCQDTFFRSRFGLTVVTNILYRLGMFNMEVHTPEEQARQNFGRELMFMCGILDAEAENLEEVVKSWGLIRKKPEKKPNAEGV